MSSASLRNGRSVVVGFSARNSKSKKISFSSDSPAAGNRPPSPQPTSQIAALPTTSAMAAAQENHPSELITDACGVTDFSGALPKAEIQATQFLLNVSKNKYTEYISTKIISSAYFYASIPTYSFFTATATKKNSNFIPLPFFFCAAASFL